MQTLSHVLQGPYSFLVYIQLGIVGLLLLWLVALVLRRAFESFRSDTAASKEIDALTASLQQKLNEVLEENRLLKEQIREATSTAKPKAPAPASEPRRPQKPIDDLMEQIDALTRSASRA